MPIQTKALTLFFLVLWSAQYTVGHIRAPLIKQHFISATELLSKQRPRVSEVIPRQIPPLPYAAKFSGCEQLDLMKEENIDAFRRVLSSFTNCFGDFHLKCFYFMNEGERSSSPLWTFAWFDKDEKTRAAAFHCIGVISQVWVCFCFLFFCDWFLFFIFSVINNQAEKKPARDAIHWRKRSFTDLNTVLMYPPGDFVKRQLVLNNLYISDVSCQTFE